MCMMSEQLALAYGLEVLLRITSFRRRSINHDIEMAIRSFGFLDEEKFVINLEEDLFTMKTPPNVKS